MKILLPLIGLLGLFVTTVRGAESAVLGELRAADDERIAAMVADDHARLDAILSDDLRYAHSTGTVDNKASFVHALDTGLGKYVGVDYETRDFKIASNDIALMSGRATFRIEPNGKSMSLHLGFLAVWRRENGHWRFLAWQSCPVPATRTEGSEK